MAARPVFYGDPKYGRMNLRLVTDPSLKTTRWELTYLPSEITPELAAGLGRSDTAGQHRFQLKPESITPGAQTLWSDTVERTDEDIADLLFATPYQYTMRHRFPRPPGVARVGRAR